MSKHTLARALGGMKCTRCGEIFQNENDSRLKPCVDAFDAVAAVRKAIRLREAAMVERCHGTPHLRSYSVGFHSYNAAVLLLLLHPTLLPNLEKSPAGRLLLAALFHDSHERWLGDLYGPAKWKYPELGEAHDSAARDVNERLGLGFLNELDPESRAWVKAVDRVELRQWALDELAFGNHNVEAILKRGGEELERMPLPPNVADFLDKLHWARTDEHLEDRDGSE